MARHVLVDKLLGIIETKKTNLCVAADFTTKEENLRLCRAVAEHICMIKIHWRFIRDLDNEFWTTLAELSRKHNFLIFEDSKYNETGQSLAIEYERVAPYVHIVTVADRDQGIYGEFKRCVEEFRASGLIAPDEPRGCLALLDMSTAIDSGHKNRFNVNEGFEEALKHRAVVIGIISQNCKFGPHEEGNFIKCTPGVHLVATGDEKNQRYRTPEYAVETLESDVIIVGRGIAKDLENAEKVAIEYKTRGFEAYSRRKGLSTPKST